MNVVVIAVVIMLALSLPRVHVVFSLAVGVFIDGLMAGMPLENVTNVAGDVVQQGIIPVFNEGLKGRAQIALSYAMPGAFAMAITHSGLLQQLAGVIIHKLNGGEDNVKGEGAVRWILLAVILCVGVMNQNIVPTHIAFIPIIISPLLLVFNRSKLDHRLVACVITFSLVTTYVFLPYGFDTVFLNDIMLGNIYSAGMDTGGINVMHAMTIPALGMVSGSLLAFLHCRRPHIYQNNVIDTEDNREAVQQQEPSTYRSLVTAVAIVVCFAIQFSYDGSLVLGAMLGFAVFMMLGVMNRSTANDVFGEGIKMTAVVGLITIAAQGFAAVVNATGDIQSLVERSMALFGSSEGMAAFTMLFAGPLATMGIGSSFLTLSIIIAVYAPLCISLGFSPMAIMAIVGTAGAPGGAGSPTPDLTLGPTMGLNVGGQHDHIRDLVIPAFIYHNIPLMVAGQIATMVL